MALQAAVRAALAEASGRLGQGGADVHEGIHQGRKALRRMRALLALGAPALGPGTALIDREVQRISRALSRWRDGQALVEALDRLLKREDDPQRLEALRHAREAALRARAELGDAAAGDGSPLPAMRARLGTLQAALPSLAWDAVTSETVDAALAASERRRKAIERVVQRGKTADWHRLRKRVRRLVQQHAALAPLGLGARLSDAASARERQLAKRLGRAQDDVLILARCAEHAVFGRRDRKVLRPLARKRRDRARRKALRLLRSGADAAVAPAQP
jgi:CHAD domain-containing protein